MIPEAEKEGIISMGKVGPLADRLVSIAEDELPDPITLELTAWDDGDYSLSVFHTHPTKNGNIEERSEVRHRPLTDEIVVRHYRYHKLEGGFIEEDERVVHP